MKKVLKKTFLVVMILIGNAWLYTRIFWPSTITDAPELIANLYAKEVCTCRFVTGFSAERCIEEQRVLLSPSSVKVDDTRRIVRARVLWAIAEAKHDSPRFGCVR